MASLFESGISIISKTILGSEIELPFDRMNCLHGIKEQYTSENIVRLPNIIATIYLSWILVVFASVVFFLEIQLFKKSCENFHGCFRASTDINALNIGICSRFYRCIFINISGCAQTFMKVVTTLLSKAEYSSKF